MATTRKTITLTAQQDEWVKAQIAAGDFTNESEFFRDLIRREQDRRMETENIRAALVEGERSGEPKAFNAGRFKQEMTARHGKKAR